ncbi:MAG: hypothetical protein WKG01_32415, partial [Kofleriaceae bacterium]
FHVAFARAAILPSDAGIAIAVAAPAAMSLFGTVLLVIALGMLLHMGAPFGFMFVLLVIGTAIVSGGVSLSNRALRFKNAPIQRCVAVIVKERTEVFSGEHRATTSYFATLQLRGGTRVELATYRSVSSKVVVGDIGIAYVKSQTLVDFARFDVE